MDIRPIKTDADHGQALHEIERLWGSEEGSPNGDKLDVLMTLVAAYEEHRWPVPKASPPEILRHAISDMGRSQEELGKLLGSRSRASEVLSGRRRLTVRMIDTISSAWSIPAELLVRAYPVEVAAAASLDEPKPCAKRHKRSDRNAA